ncbi:DUF1273 domain-containing protein [Gorillibacterium sp. sgz5001074]|uniref:DUF1273 domain-containing protein n=1 Tax=Gorillibacterium sp. sgz5001074 TaxID=3446695 RepID=UPI003F67AFE9
MSLERILITGYKASELGIHSMKHPGIPIIKKAVAKVLRGLLEDGLEWVVVSGQWGVELWAAEAALELREEYPALRLAVITPYENQEEHWGEEKQEWYRSLLARADYKACVSKRGYEGPWQFKAKDRFLLRNTDGLLLLYDEEKEGSPRYLRAEAQRYAAIEPYRIITITAQDLQDTADEERPAWD